MRGGVLSYYAEKENHPDNRWRSHRTNEDARGCRKAQRERNHRNVFSGVPGSVQGFRQGYREGQAETLIPAELSTSTSWTSAFEFSSLLVLLPYLPGQLRLFLDRVELFARLSMIGA